MSRRCNWWARAFIISHQLHQSARACARNLVLVLVVACATLAHVSSGWQKACASQAPSARPIWLAGELWPASGQVAKFSPFTPRASRTQTLDAAASATPKQQTTATAATAAAATTTTRTGCCEPFRSSGRLRSSIGVSESGAATRVCLLSLSLLSRRVYLATWLPPSVAAARRQQGGRAD